MRIGVLGNKNKVKNAQTIENILQKLQSWGYETARFSCPSDIRDVDVVIILGGDGAILHASVLSAKRGVKIIGINYGNLGFLAEFEREEWDEVNKLLARIQTNTCRILKRSVLQVEVFGKKFYALNEIALQRDPGMDATKGTQILRVQMQTDEGTDVISGDGLLVCTPTGSTAYSLSAGGAILTPEVPVVMMTPICAFSMRSRPIVFADTETLRFRIARGKAMLLADGMTVGPIPENTQITIKKAEFTADFPIREGSDFFLRVRNKLNQ